MNAKIKRWLPLFLWFIVIFGLSSIPRLPGDGISLPRGFDKVMHCLEYAVFAIFLYRGSSYHKKSVDWNDIRRVIILGLVVGSLDELYQSIFPERDSSVFDLIADMAGVLMGSALAFIWHLRRSKKVERI
ncbi:MAG: VanZ family protein [Candidatus Krumholzibacteriota bacterium]|nr:VanZ family protein [Candidatus Krumholzibacteriota bacterium]